MKAITMQDQFMSAPKAASNVAPQTAKNLKHSCSGINKPLLLRPVVHPIVQNFLDRKKLVNSLAKALGSPLNVMFPELLPENIQKFHDTFAHHNILGRIFVAHKATRSDSLMRRLAIENVSCDVASLDELKHALSSGFDGERLEATGPKNADFIALCLMHSVVLNIDSVAELKLTIALADQLPIKAPLKILLRLSGFGDHTTSALRKSSRFGVSLNEVEEALALLGKSKEKLDLLGYSFHLDTTSVEERAQAIERCLALFDESINRGFSPKVLNIGGGYRINHLASEHDWSDYVAALKQSLLENQKLDQKFEASPQALLTWHNNSFGMTVEGGVLKGNFNSYDFFEPLAGAKFLHEILQQRIASMNDATVAKILQSNMIELWIEPGRAIFDQCGVTVARVNSVRRASGGEELVSLNMKRSDLAFLDQEMFVDPVVIYGRSSTTSSGNWRKVFFAGNLCLESDLIYRHATFLPKLPEPSDLVAFVNTAAYAMDFSSSQAIMQPSARKVAVATEGKSFTWVLDELYSPVQHALVQHPSIQHAPHRHASLRDASKKEP